MPELPEVETVMRGLEQSVLGQNISSVQVNRYDLRFPVAEDFGQQVTGCDIRTLHRRGKYIILDFGDDLSGILHLGMSGRVRIFDAGAEYVARPHDHLIFHLDKGVRFAFEDPRRFGMFLLRSRRDWANEPPFSAMGVEPLEDVWDGQNLFDMISRKKTSIKSALLDQRVVAGLGNIYVCEALFCARVAPTRICSSITLDEATRIVSCSKEILKRAIEAGGSTLRDFQKIDGSLGYFQYQFSVYDQEGQACPSGCGAEVMRIVQSGRSTFYCPSCQK